MTRRPLGRLALSLALSLGTAVLAAAALLAAPVSASAAPTAGNPCVVRPYPDVAGSSPFCPAIIWLGDHRITRGYDDGGFHPAAPVTRAAMAAFLYRADTASTSAPACTEAPFPDVPVSNQFCGAIAWMADHHYAAGYSDGNFHPNAPISRQAAASFLWLATHASEPNQGCVVAPFPDVPPSNQFCGDILWLAQSGGSKGYADGEFHPTASVSRQAMAVYLSTVFVPSGTLSDVGVLDCLAGGKTAITTKPSSLVLACGDATSTVTGISWSSFGGQTAVGSARLNIDDCTPDCASGTTHSEAATVTLTDPALFPAGTSIGTPPLYLHITVIPAAPNTNHFPSISQTLPG